GVSVVDFATGRVRALTRPALGEVTGFAWSPDSMNLLIATHMASSRCPSLWLVRVDGPAHGLLRHGHIIYRWLRDHHGTSVRPACYRGAHALPARQADRGRPARARPRARDQAGLERRALPAVPGRARGDG